MTFVDALVELLVGESGQLTSYKGSKILAFAVASFLMAFLAVLLDRVVFAVRGRSFFNLNYGTGFGGTVRLLLLWSAGAGLGGLLGSGASIVQVTRPGCITVGVGWPLILPRLIDSATKKEEEQQPEQP